MKLSGYLNVRIGMLITYIGLFFIYLYRFLLPLLCGIFLVFFFFFNDYLFLLLSLLAVAFSAVFHELVRREEKIGPIHYDFEKEGQGDVRLLVSKNEILASSNASRWSHQDWSLAWMNTLEQEIGCFSVSDVSKGFGKEKVIIISSSVKKVDTENIKELAKSGRTIILEKPVPEVYAAFNITFARSKRAVKATSPPLEGLPLYCKMDVCSFSGFQIILEFDGFPAIIEKKIGKGKIVFLLFEYTRQLIALQQGVPKDDYAVVHRNGLIGMVEPADMIYSQHFLNNNVPYADILESLVVERFEVLRWDKMPAGYDSAMVITHDEDYCKEKCIAIIEEEISQGLPSTYFATSHQSLVGKFKGFFQENGVEVGIHWDKFLNCAVPGRKGSKDLHRQIRRVGLPVLSNRNHFLKWSPHYTRAFRQLVKNKIQVDSTYGLNYGKGYGFSTSYFFRPLDTNGQAMPILELPFQIMEDRGGVDASYLKKLITDNNHTFHGVLCVNYHPSDYFLSKKMREIIYQEIKEQRILGMTVKSFLEFHQQRIKSNIRRKKSGFIVKPHQEMELVFPGNTKKVRVDGRQQKMKVRGKKKYITLKRGEYEVLYE